MKPIQHGCNWSRLFSAALWVISALMNSSPAADPKPGAVLPPSLLGPEYVDILNGFSMRPAVGFELDSNFAALDSAGGYKEGIYSLTAWDTLKTLSSKPLIRFVDPKTGIELIVSVLAPRHTLKMNEMLEGRSGFWKQFQENAQIVTHPEEMANDRPMGWIEVTLPAAAESAPPRKICEALIQQDPGRYISLLWSAKGTGVLECPSETNDLVVRNFSCPKEDLLKQRWNQARKQAQHLLEAIRPKILKSDLQKDHWFRIAYKEQDIGFRCTRQQAWKTEEKKYIEIDCYDSFLPDQGLPYMQSRGLYPIPVDDESAVTWLSRLVAVQGKIILQEDCKSETGELQYWTAGDASSVFQEKTSWASGKIEITRQQAGSSDSYSESMKVKDATYLGSGLWELFGRLGELKPNQEFLFNRYQQGQLDYCYIRVITVAAPAPTTDEKAAPAPLAEKSSPPPDSAAGPMTFLTAKMGLSGPVMELWLDANGVLTQWRCNGFVGARQDEPSIRARWPAETERMRF